jgi:hypothetical protein
MEASDSHSEENKPRKGRQKEAALSGLLCSSTIAKAAQSAGISEGTLLRWLKTDETFKADYQAARRAVVSHAVAQLQRASGGAVSVLCAVASDKEAPASSRVGAARAILDFAFRAVELEDLQARVEALEGVLKANGN